MTDVLERVGCGAVRSVGVDDTPFRPAQVHSVALLDPRVQVRPAPLLPGDLHGSSANLHARRRPGAVRDRTLPAGARVAVASPHASDQLQHQQGRQRVRSQRRRHPAGDRSKWSLKALAGWLGEHGHDPAPIFDRLHDLMVKTIIAAEGNVRRKCQRLRVGRTNCFELFGVDVLLDVKLRPWLLEVNILPSLSSSSPLDKLIKTTLMSDVLHIIGVDPVDTRSVAPGAKDASASRPISRIYMEALMLGDVQILREVELEHRRRGHLQRIFPVASRSYAGFFEGPLYNNVLVERWLALPRRQALRLIGFGDDVDED